MQRILYFICPTDCLEPIINNTSDQENFFYSSLCNSVSFDDEIIKTVINLILSKSIREISFVLSDDNPVLLDALGTYNFSEISGLKNFYHQIRRNKAQTEASWQTPRPERLILSYHLNDKIKELKRGLNDLFFDPLQISGKIYHRQGNYFKDIYADLISPNNFSFN